MNSILMCLVLEKDIWNSCAAARPHLLWHLLLPCRHAMQLRSLRELRVGGWSKVSLCVDGSSNSGGGSSSIHPSRPALLPHMRHLNISHANVVEMNALLPSLQQLHTRGVDE